MVKTLKNFGALCAVESVAAFTFLVTVALCIHEGELIAALVAFGVAVGAVVLGVVRYRQQTAAPKTDTPAMSKEEYDATRPMSKEEYDTLVKPKRNRAKPAKAAPRPKRAKVKRK